jgi:flavin-dependent dehydrogenase
MSRAVEIYDVVIAGGGPAGTSAAIHLALRGARVLLAEQKRFPRAKLCGEFISPECLEHFERLGVAERMMMAGGAELSETVFYSRSGKCVSVPSAWFGKENAGGALGLSRAEMDARLLARAREVGVEVQEETQANALLLEQGRARGVRLKRNGQSFEVSAHLVIDATGRAGVLARQIEKSESPHHAVKRGSPLVAFKAHLENAHGCADHCEIYFYKRGYGGLSRVEGGLSNLCFIASARDVRACGNDAERVMHEVVMKNRRAAQTLEHARARSVWLAVALEGFGRRRIVPAAGLLAIGDAASFIDPFTGSGMLMALESGEVAGLAVARHLQSLRNDESFAELARDYRAHYDRAFRARLRVCALMRRAAFVPRMAETLIFALGASTRARRALALSTRKARRKAEGGRMKA